jgi:hypothetical protein
MQIKRWESPRRRGRNDKGRGGSARSRQLKKQNQVWRQKLKPENPKAKDQNPSTPAKKREKRDRDRASLFFRRCLVLGLSFGA